jgi:hypothetical protein
MSTSYTSTGEFNPGIGKRGVGNAVSLFLGQLWVMGSGSDSQLYQTTFTFGSKTFAGSANNWAVTNAKNWINPPISLPNLIAPKSWGKCGSDVLGDQSALYLFWMSNSYFMAASTQGATGSGPATWSEGFVLLDQAGALLTPRSHGADVSAIAFGQTAFLAAFPIQYAEAGKGNVPAVYIGLFDVGGQTPQNLVTTHDGQFPSWAARAEAVIPADTLTSFAQTGTPVPVTFLDPGRGASIAWFPFVPGDGTSPVFYLLAFLTPQMSNATNHNFSWPIQLLLSMDPSTGAPLITGADAPLVMFNNMAPQSEFIAARDPAGRIFGYAMGDKQVEALAYSTFAVPTAPPEVTPDDAANSASGTPPTAFFYVDTTTPATPVDPPNSTSAVTAYNVYRFLFYGGDVVTQVDYFGQVQTLQSGTGTLTPNDQVALPLTRITGIIEGPLPIPNENVAGFIFESSPADCGSLLFSRQDGTTSSITAQVTAGIGIQSQGNATVGIGGAWDLSIQANYVHNWDIQHSQTDIYGLTQSSLANTDDQNRGTALETEGAVVGSPPPVITVTPFRFVDAGGAAIGDPTSPSDNDQAARFLSITLAPNTGLSATYTYQPFMVEPGSLLSYAPESINTTMAALYDAKGMARSWTDYFQEVILANAQNLGATCYLEFTRSINSTTQTSWVQNDSSSTTNGFNFSASAYAGLAVNFQVEGIGFESKVMYGFQVSAYTNIGAGSTDQSGISIPTLGSIPLWGDESGYFYKHDYAKWATTIVNYTFLVFFLPPPKNNPNLWATELAAFGPVDPTATIDPGSQPWKMVFVVTGYQTGADWVQKQMTYSYSGDLTCP